MWDENNCGVRVLNFIVAASFCLYWFYPEKKLGQYSEIKIQNPRENEYKRYCLDGRECYYLIDKDTVGCICTWLNGEKRCDKYKWWT